MPRVSSPARVCPHTRCGGCPLLSLAPDAQIERKRGHVRAAFTRYPGLGGSDIPPPSAAATAFAYRTRAKLVVSPSGDVGLYAPRSHDVVDIPSCLVLSPALLAVAAALRAELRARPAPVSGVDLRETHWLEGTKVLVTLIGQARDERALAELAQRVARFDSILGVAVSTRDPRSPQLLGDLPERVAGAEVAKDSLSPQGPYHYASYGAFVQAHRGQAQAIVERAARELSRALGKLAGARILELYAGSGALGLALAQQGAQVVLVERYEPALALVSRAADEQGIRGLATRAGDVEAVLLDLVHERQRFDAVIVDPPRRGLTPLSRARIAALAPKLLFYVSCNPETLARDLADFAQRGLAVGALQPLDMMPQSDDVECVATLAPSEPSALSVLHEDDALVAVDKPPHLPTIPESEHALSLLERLRVQLGVAQLFAVHRLDAGTSGVCLFAKRAEDVAPLSAALAAGQKHYLALVRGIAHAKGTIRKPLRDGKTQREAVTRYTKQEVVSGHTLLRVRPEQGRKHQVRRHLAGIGHPVLGDARYGAAPSNRHFEHKHGLDRAFLHLSRIELALAGRAEPLVLVAPLAPDLEAVLASLRADEGPRPEPR